MQLDEFLADAKINTYASAGEGSESKLEDGSKELIFEENGFKYMDRYFGSDPFGGQEVVWHNGKILWSMNYYGRIISNEILQNVMKEFMDFLKKSLRHVAKEKPFRGPEHFEEGNFKYMNETDGELKAFKGTERIFWKGEEVYILHYHGGYVRSFSD